MDWTRLEPLLTSVPLWSVAGALFVSMALAAFITLRVRQARERKRPLSKEELEENRSAEGYIVSAVLGLLALLLGFTFSLAVDRFDARRLLVRQEATTIGAAYLRAQLLDEPDRARTSRLIAQYVDTRVALGKDRGARRAELLAVNDRLADDIWAATAAALDNIKCYDWSSSYLESIAAVLELDAARKSARMARVPAQVFIVLFVYMVATAAVLGHVVRGNGVRIAAGVLLALLTLTLVMIIDIDGPIGGAVFENQRPMELLQRRIASYPPGMFQKWRSASPARCPSAAVAAPSPAEGFAPPKT